MVKKTDIHFMTTLPDHSRILKRASYASFSLSFILIFIKLYAAIVTDALSMQASLIDSLVDSLASLINLIAIHHALRPADNDHRFGHGKIEALAAQGQSIFVAITALWVMGKAVHRFIYPQPIYQTTLGMVVLVITIISTLILYLYQRQVIIKTNSTIIKADSLHYKGDLFLNLSVIVALMFATYSALIDTFCGFAIGAYILYMSWSIARESFDVLLDRELSKVHKDEIINVINSHPDVRGFHDLKTRSSGQKKFVQFHIELEEDLSLKQAHMISSDIHQILKSKFPEMDIIIHEDTHEEIHSKDQFKN